MPLSKGSRPNGLRMEDVVSLETHTHTPEVRASKAGRTKTSKEPMELSKATWAPRMRSSHKREHKRPLDVSGKRRPIMALFIHCYPLGDSSKSFTARSEGH